MNLQQIIIKLENDHSIQLKHLLSIEKELDTLRSCKQPTNEELYKDIRKYVDIDIDKKKYEHILGGDGRSQPWSEMRTGIVATATKRKGVYLNDAQERIVIDFIKNTGKTDTIQII